MSFLDLDPLKMDVDEKHFPEMNKTELRKAISKRKKWLRNEKNSLYIGPAHMHRSDCMGVQDSIDELEELLTYY